MKKIYVVTKGCYSDYHIIAATLDEEKANRIAGKFNDEWDNCKVEVYEDSDIYEKPVWFACFNQQGCVSRVEECGHSSDYAYSSVGCIQRVITGDAYSYVSANSEEEAVKIASELYARFIAKEKGLI